MEKLCLCLCGVMAFNEGWGFSGPCRLYHGLRRFCREIEKLDCGSFTTGSSGA